MPYNDQLDVPYLPASFKQLSEPLKFSIFFCLLFLILGQIWIGISHFPTLLAVLEGDQRELRHVLQDEFLVLLATGAVFFAGWFLSHRIYRTLLLQNEAFDSVSEGIVITDPNQPGNPIESVNQAFQEITGYDENEVLGRNCRFLQGEETDDATREELREAIDARESITTEILNYRKNGTAFWNQLSIDPVYRDGELIRFIGIQRDVTERVNLQERLRKREHRFSTMAETIDQAFFLLTPDYDWIYVNSAFQELYGVGMDQLEEDPMAWRKYIPESDFQEEIHSDVVAHQNHTMENNQLQTFRVMLPQESTRWLRVKVYPVHDDEGEVGSIGRNEHGYYQ